MAQPNYNSVLSPNDMVPQPPWVWEAQVGSSEEHGLACTAWVWGPPLWSTSEMQIILYYTYGPTTWMLRVGPLGHSTYKFISTSILICLPSFTHLLNSISKWRAQWNTDIRKRVLRQPQELLLKDGQEWGEEGGVTYSRWSMRGAEKMTLWAKEERKPPCGQGGQPGRNER